MLSLISFGIALVISGVYLAFFWGSIRATAVHVASTQSTAISMLQSNVFDAKTYMQVVKKQMLIHEDGFLQANRWPHRLLLKIDKNFALFFSHLQKQQEKIDELESVKKQ